MSDPRKNFVCSVCGYLVNDLERSWGRDSPCPHCERIKYYFELEIKHNQFIEDIFDVCIARSWGNDLPCPSFQRLESTAMNGEVKSICKTNWLEFVKSGRKMAKKWGLNVLKLYCK